MTALQLLESAFNKLETETEHSRTETQKRDTTDAWKGKRRAVVRRGTNMVNCSWTQSSGSVCESHVSPKSCPVIPAGVSEIRISSFIHLHSLKMGVGLIASLHWCGACGGSATAQNHAVALQPPFYSNSIPQKMAQSYECSLFLEQCRRFYGDSPGEGRLDPTTQPASLQLQHLDGPFQRCPGSGSH